MKRITSTQALAAIVLLGAVLRLFPIWFGLPYLQARPDENASLYHAVAVLDGDPNPHFFHWPSLTFYVFAALFFVSSIVRRALLVRPDLTTAQQLIVARAFVALAGTLTIVMVFRLARRMADETVGLLAAAFLAVAFLHVRDSHFAMTDILMTCLVTLSLALLLRALDRAREWPPAHPRAVRWFSAAGFAGGLAASTKYSAAAVVAAMAAAQLVLLVDWKGHRWRPDTWRPSLVFLVAFAFGFIVATPYALLDYPTFAADLKFDFAHLSGGHAANLGRGWSYHLMYSLPYSVGIPTFIAGITGIVPMARHYGRPALVIGAFAAAFYAIIGSGQTVFFRYILPLVPVVCVSAAVAVRHAGLWLALHTSSARAVNRAGAAAIALLAGIVAAPSFVNSVWFDILLAKTDTRVVAGRWLIPRVKPDESIYQAGGLLSELYLDGAPVHRWRFDATTNAFADAGGRTPDWLVFQESPLWTYATVPPELHRLAAEKYVRVVVVPATKGSPTERAGPAFYDLEDAFFMPVSGFSTVERPGPTISIYRRADLP